jgi:hypothetical protein
MLRELIIHRLWLVEGMNARLNSLTNLCHARESPRMLFGRFLKQWTCEHIISARLSIESRPMDWQEALKKENDIDESVMFG